MVPAVPVRSHYDPSVSNSILKSSKIIPNGRWNMDMFDVLWIVFVLVLSFGIGLFTRYVL